MAEHTEQEIKNAAERFERWAASVDPATIKWQDTTDLSAIACAADTVRADEARLEEAVRAARENGHSWNRIALALGVSRQAARQRFSDKISTHS